MRRSHQKCNAQCVGYRNTRKACQQAVEAVIVVAMVGKRRRKDGGEEDDVAVYFFDTGYQSTLLLRVAVRVAPSCVVLLQR